VGQGITGTDQWDAGETDGTFHGTFFRAITIQQIKKQIYIIN
jgi:hypothetical protein